MPSTPIQSSKKSPTVSPVINNKLPNSLHINTETIDDLLQLEKTNKIKIYGANSKLATKKSDKYIDKILSWVKTDIDSNKQQTKNTSSSTNAPNITVNWSVNNIPINNSIQSSLLKSPKFYTFTYTIPKDIITHKISNILVDNSVNSILKSVQQRSATGIPAIYNASNLNLNIIVHLQ